VESKRFTGGPSPSGQGGVPDITQGKLQTWKVEDFVETLDTGMTPDSDKVGGLMTEVVANTSKLSAADREAMAVYLKSLPAAKDRKRFYLSKKSFGGGLAPPIHVFDTVERGCPRRARA